MVGDDPPAEHGRGQEQEQAEPLALEAGLRAAVRCTQVM